MRKFYAEIYNGQTYADIKDEFFEQHPDSRIFGSVDDEFRNFMFMLVVSSKYEIATIDWDETLVSAVRGTLYSSELIRYLIEKRADVGVCIEARLISGRKYQYCVNPEWITLKPFLQHKKYVVVYTAAQSQLTTVIGNMMNTVLQIEKTKLKLIFREKDAHKKYSKIERELGQGVDNMVTIDDMADQWNRKGQTHLQISHRFFKAGKYSNSYLIWAKRYNVNFAFWERQLSAAGQEDTPFECMKIAFVILAVVVLFLLRALM